MHLADVALPVPLDRPFSYEIPPALAARAVPGARVVCRLGARRLVGVVLAVREGEPPRGVRPIDTVVDEIPSIPTDLLAFLRDLSSYYFAPIGQVVRLALPPMDRETEDASAEPELFQRRTGVRGPKPVAWVLATATGQTPRPLRGHASAILAHVRAMGAVPLPRLVASWPSARGAVKRLADSGLVTVEQRLAEPEPLFAETIERDTAPVLNAEQAEATRVLLAALREPVPATFLLHGVTGSGKTEVYLHAVAAARERQRGAIVLVPEIALTPQLVQRFRARFGDNVAVLHSALTPKERWTMWQRVRSGPVDVVVGARSALFAPVAKLGLIVVDEEHDPSFKQDEGVRYHARDMAILRAHRVGAIAVLGSATPSVESEQLVRAGKAKKLRLPSRARAQPMPLVEIVDLRRVPAGPTGDKRLSLPLVRAMAGALEAGEQVILFLNRRGFAPAVRCEACGEALMCPSCSVALTHHKVQGLVVRCHYCDFEEKLPSACPKCKQVNLALEGIGTEKLEDSLRLVFPKARIARLDRDVASGKRIEEVLARVRAREVDILVGTQMVTKGHDLPHVTVVGVVNADAALFMPDFRASERAFQLLVQVAGRAGRGDRPGKVLVQTYAPEHPSIQFGCQHDVAGFLDRELLDRKELGYPPFSRAALVRVEGPDESAARAGCALLAEVARRAAVERTTVVAGPSAAPLPRLRNRFRFRVMVRSVDRGHLRRVLTAVDQARGQLPRELIVVLDIDPVHLL